MRKNTVKTKPKDRGELTGIFVFDDAASDKVIRFELPCIWISGIFLRLRNFDIAIERQSHTDTAWLGAVSMGFDAIWSRLELRKKCRLANSAELVKSCVKSARGARRFP